MNEDETEEEMKEDLIEEDIEAQNELREELSEEDAEAYGITEPEKQYDRFKFLTEVRELPDTIRTSFLSKQELGSPLFPVRFWLNLEILARLRGYKLVGDFLLKKALITTHSGLSKEGFLLNTAITNRREALRKKSRIKQETGGENVKKG